MTNPFKRFIPSSLNLYHIWCPVVCLVLVILNSAILDYYLIRHSGLIHYLWIIADIFVLCVFLVAFVKSYKYFKQDKVDTPEPTGLQYYFGNLPFSYISWLTFSFFMSTKVFVIYKQPNSIFSQVEGCNLTPKECVVFGPNTLKAGISLAALVFKLLVFSHNDGEESTTDYDFTQHMVGIAHLDILDSTQFLDAFSEDINVTVNVTVNDTINYTINDTVYMGVYSSALSYTCANYMMPTEALFFLAWSRSGFSSNHRRLVIFHLTMYYFIVNVPILIIRIVIWQMQNMEISVFIMKNIIAIAKMCQVVLGFCSNVSSCAHEENGTSVVMIAESPESAMNETTPLVIDPLQSLGEVNLNSPQM